MEFAGPPQTPTCQDAQIDDSFPTAQSYIRGFHMPQPHRGMLLSRLCVCIGKWSRTSGIDDWRLCTIFEQHCFRGMKFFAHYFPFFFGKNTITGAYDDPNGSHISIEVVSDAFEGKRAVQRQQLVYKAIWEELQGPVVSPRCISWKALTIRMISLSHFLFSHVDRICHAKKHAVDAMVCRTPKET